MREKGFTLTELLAVIVVISVVLLIVVPLIANVLGYAQKSAFKVSASGIIKTAEITRQRISFDNPEPGNIIFNFKDGVETSNFEDVKLEYTGQKIKDGTLIIREDRKVALSIYDGKWCAEKEFDSSEITVTKKTLEECEAGSSFVIINLNGDNPQYVEINTNYIEHSIEAKTMNDEIIDDVSIEIKLNDNVVEIVDTTLFNEYIINYSVVFMDKIYEANRTVIVRDTTKPELTIPGDVTIPIDDLGSFNAMDGVFASDNSNEEINVLVSGDLSSIPGEYTLIYSAKDSSGNETIKTRIVIVSDGTDPVITINPLGNTTYAKSRSTTVKVTDEHSGIKASSLKYVWTTTQTEPALELFTNAFNNNQTVNTPTNVTGSYYLWVMASDTSNNTAVARSNIFNLDNTLPVITINGNANITIDKGSSYNDAGATATDNIDGNIVVNVSGTVNTNILGTYTITYTAMDSSGNNAIPVVRTINVVDATAPVITILGNNPYNINVGATYMDPGVTAIDDVDGDITTKVVTTGAVNVNIPGTYTITYTVTDNAGNKSTATRTVNVVDNVPPTVSFGSNGNTTYAKNRSTTVTVSDAHSGVNASSLKYLWNTSTTQPSESSFTSSFTNGGTISSTSVSGGYYLWILAKDTSGNTTIQRSNAFNLDNTAPVITSVTSNATNIKENSFTITRSGNATDTHSGLATNPYIYQRSTNGTSWTTVCTNNATSCNVTGLSGYTTYYYRICVNDILSNQSCITSKTTVTQETGILTDSRDGKTYPWVKIGNQVWMADNLKYTGNGCLSKTWNDSAPYDACRANGSEIHYQWGAAMNGSTTQGAQGLCPAGWHIPTDAEWKALEGTVDSTYGVGSAVWNNTGWRGSDVGKKLKSTSVGGTDDYGFNGLLAGVRNTGGTPYSVGSDGVWWSSSPSGSYAWSRNVSSSFVTVARSEFSQAYGFSVRCVWD